MPTTGMIGQAAEGTLNITEAGGGRGGRNRREFEGGGTFDQLVSWGQSVKCLSHKWVYAALR